MNKIHQLKLISVTGVVAVLTAMMLMGCALSSPGPGGGSVTPGSLAERGNLNGVTVVVGGKEFTEQQILCEVAAQALTSVGATVQRECGMSGSATVRAALESGGIDMYWEYTGTGWITHLGQTNPSDDPAELWETLARTDAEQNGVSWLPPAPANNTYAIAASSEASEELGVTLISEYAELVRTDPAQAKFCGAAEFFGRDDGWPGLMEAYKFDLPREHTSELAAGAIYNGIATQTPCRFGEVFATDGRIRALGLTVLEDDEKFFTPYNAALTVRSEVLTENPQIAEIFAPISQALTNDVLQTLNAEVDGTGIAPTDVANTWLKSEGFIGE